MSYSLLSQLSFELQLAGLWEEKLKEEQVKTGPLEEVCAALREALDAETKKRMEAFENKMKPIIIKDGPSRKVSTTSFFQQSISILTCQRTSYDMDEILKPISFDEISTYGGPYILMSTLWMIFWTIV